MGELNDQLKGYTGPVYTPYDPDTKEGLQRANPTDEEINDEYAAPGKPAEHPLGVLFKADHETLEDGMCRQARFHARALALGAPVTLVSINNRVRHGAQTHTHVGDDMLHPSVLAEVKELRARRIGRYALCVYHTVIDQVTALRRLLLPTHALATIGVADELLGRTIVYTPWERSTVHPDIVKLLNKCGQLWLQCSRNVAVFKDAGVKPELIRLVPNGFDPETPTAKIAETHPHMPEGRRYYNIGKWEPRKAQHELVGAFLHAHSPDDAASLIIKTSSYGIWKDYLGPKDSLKHWAAQEDVKAKGWSPETIAKRVLIYDRIFREDEMVKLHALNNIYVSAAHAEGWDYPAFDACAAGNRLVHVGFGGSEDYAGPHDERVEILGTEPVPQAYGWEASAEWARYDVKELADAMKRARLGARRTAPAGLHDKYGRAATSFTMWTHLRELLSEEELKGLGRP